MFALPLLALKEAASLNTFLSLNIKMKKKVGMIELHLCWEDVFRLREQKGVLESIVFTGQKEGFYECVELITVNYNCSK